MEMPAHLGMSAAGPTEAFDKDAWIKRALAARHIVVQPDGRIGRFLKVIDGKRYYTVQAFQTHKKSGRVYFNMTFEGITKSVLVNRVVGIALIPNPHNLPEVNHKDGIKKHNHPDNLEWSSRSDQEKHAHATGLKASRGSSNANAKLTAAEVAIIRAAPDENLSALAITLKVSRKTISDIRKRITWRHL
jgi:hypothetical protein